MCLLSGKALLKLQTTASSTSMGPPKKIHRLIPAKSTMKKHAAEMDRALTQLINDHGKSRVVIDPWLSHHSQRKGGAEESSTVVLFVRTSTPCRQGPLYNFTYLIDLFVQEILVPIPSLSSIQPFPHTTVTPHAEPLQTV